MALIKVTTSFKEFVRTLITHFYIYCRVGTIRVPRSVAVSAQLYRKAGTAYTE